MSSGVNKYESTFDDSPKFVKRSICTNYVTLRQVKTTCSHCVIFNFHYHRVAKKSRVNNVNIVRAKFSRYIRLFIIDNLFLDNT
jgi:hypothetical protein